MDPREIREQVIKEAKSRLILDAAHTVFARKGYWEARLEDIAAAVGFSKASLYNYYPDKESIFLSLSIREYQGVFDALDEEARLDKPFLVSVEAMLRIIFDHFCEHFSFLVNISNYRNMMILHQDMARHPDLSQQLHELLMRGLASLRKVVERARDRGEISGPHDPMTTALFIGSLIQSIQIISWQSGRVPDVESTVRQIIDFMRHGVGLTAKQE
jgi:AcrR family transcriptional regulator